MWRRGIPAKAAAWKAVSNRGPLVKRALQRVFFNCWASESELLSWLMGQDTPSSRWTAHETVRVSI